jgi:hypothetical protein
MHIAKCVVLIMIVSASNLPLKAQDSSKIYFTTAAGVFVPKSTFANAYENSLALNSGIEYRFSKHYFTQFVLDFNAVKYNQQLKDASSDYLFQHTNSSVFLAGFNVGRNIVIVKSNKVFASPYIGIGYVNIGEPRLTVNTATSIVLQEVTRMQGVYLKEGLRLGYNTRSKVLQTLYIDAAFWSANVEVQNSKPKALSILVGTRVGF